MAVVLVVDDEIGIRELLSEILSDEGYGVLLAENASAARAAMNQHPDLVLLDIWMPDNDGISLLKEWSSSGQLTAPVIMMSGHATLDTAVEATKFGAVDFLEKPIALSRLISAVKEALQKSSKEPRIGDSQASARIDALPGYDGLCASVPGFRKLLPIFRFSFRGCPSDGIFGSASAHQRRGHQSAAGPGGLFRSAQRSQRSI